MIVTKISPITGTVNQMDIEVDPDRYAKWVAMENPPFIQHAFPELGADEREFLLTGTTPEEWDAAFGDDE